jgi:hypothetical protein
MPGFDLPELAPSSRSSIFLIKLFFPHPLSPPRTIFRLVDIVSFQSVFLRFPGVVEAMKRGKRGSFTFLSLKNISFRSRRHSETEAKIANASRAELNRTSNRSDMGIARNYCNCFDFQHYANLPRSSLSNRNILYNKVSPLSHPRRPLQSILQSKSQRKSVRVVNRTINYLVRQSKPRSGNSPNNQSILCATSSPVLQSNRLPFPFYIQRISLATIEYRISRNTHIHHVP